jgi:hypothetical protein
MGKIRVLTLQRFKLLIHLILNNYSNQPQLDVAAIQEVSAAWRLYSIAQEFKMASARFIATFIVFLPALTLGWGRPALSETAISEQTLTSDIIIEEVFEPGDGLPVGKILSVRGQAFVFHRDPTVGYRVQSGQPLYAGDILRTRAFGWILCRLIDGSHINIKPGTSLTIVRSSYNSGRKTSASSLNLEHGSARFRLNPIPDLAVYDYKVQTKLASTLTSEADFVVRAKPDATEIIALERSRLEVTSPAQLEDVTYLSDFQKTTVSKDIISPTVDPLSQADIEFYTAVSFAAPPVSISAAHSTLKRRNIENDDPLTDPAQPEMKIED